MLLISALGVGLKYWAFKVALVKIYRKPPSFDEEMAEALRKVMARLVLPVHVASFYISQVNSTVDAPHAPMYTAIALAGVFLLLDLFLLKWIPGFGDWDQLASSGDTNGVNYDQVEALAHYDIDRYAFPRVQTIAELQAIFHCGHPARIAGKTERMRPEILSAVLACNLVQQPWTDHGPGVEDGSAPPSSGVREMLGPMTICLLRATGNDVAYHAQQQTPTLAPTAVQPPKTVVML